MGRTASAWPMGIPPERTLPGNPLAGHRRTDRGAAGTGRFAANVELAEAAGQERARLAEQLWYLYHDFSDEGRESGYLPSLAGMSGGNFPEETGRLAAQLEHPEFRADLQKEYQEFMDA